MVAMYSLSNSKITLFLILKKCHYLFEKVFFFILLSEYFGLSCIFFFFFISSDNILSCCMDVTMYAVYGHVVKFHFHSFGVNKEKYIQCNYETKPHICTRQV